MRFFRELLKILLENNWQEDYEHFSGVDTFLAELVDSLEIMQELRDKDELRSGHYVCADDV